jgi:predicted phosphodiesterase
MKTTGLFTVHEFTIHVDELGVPIYFYPFGDVHKFATLHSDDRWKEFLEKAQSRGKNAYFFGMGDYLDFMSTSERSAYLKSEYHDSTIDRIERMVESDIREFAADIEFMRGRLVGLIGGNHDFKFKHGETADQQLCRIMDCKFLGVLTLTRLRFIYREHVTHLDIYAHHGKGASKTLGGSLKRVEEMAAASEASIYLMGHDHKGPQGKTPRMLLSEANGNLAVVERVQLYARTGSFLRGFVPDENSYIADGCLNPAYLGGTEITFVASRPRDAHLKIDIHATI